MKKNIVFILLFVLCCYTKGQNLVPNYSFEYHSSCPTNYSQIYLATPWHTASYGGSPDLFDTCSAASNIPLAAGGYQTTHTGHAFMGFYGYRKLPPGGTKNVREYPQVELMDSLKQGSWYCVSFYCNLADMSDYAISRFGAYISDTAIYRNDTSYFPLTPQIENPATNLLSSKVNWMQISGMYQAHGGEKFITLGNFYPDSLTDTVNITGIINTNGFAYYFIDDVSVVNCDSLMGINEQNNISFSISPNPASEAIKITLPLNVSSTAVTIVNTMGVTVKENNITVPQNEMVIAIADLPRGVYFVKVKTNKGIGFKKFLKI